MAAAKVWKEDREGCAARVACFAGHVCGSSRLGSCLDGLPNAGDGAGVFISLQGQGDTSTRYSLIVWNNL